MRRRSILIVLLLAGVAAGSVLAATAVNPKDLVLQKSDMPAGAKRISFGTSKGTIKIPRTVHGEAGYVGYKFKNGSKTESVFAAAGVLASTRDAHDVFVNLKGKLLKTSAFKRISLPSYGNEQVSLGVTFSAGSSGILLVRSGKTLWEVGVIAFPGLSKSQGLAELKKYAAKEKARAT